MDFDFINDEKFRAILTRDFEELKICFEAKASKSVLVLSGSIIESILTYYFLNFPPNESNPKGVLSMGLDDLLKLASDNKIISQTTKDLSTVIKNYRNLIHPGREIRKNEKFNFDSANIAKSVLNIVIREVKQNYISNIGRTASDIISKLENDSISQPLFEKITISLHKSEKVKLYNLLFEYGLRKEDYPTELTEPKKYLNILKSQVDREVVVNQLMRLVNKIQTGEQAEILEYYYLLFDDLNHLDRSNIELILLYILNVLIESTNYENAINKYVIRRVFSTFGAHIITNEIENEFFKLSCAIVRNQTMANVDYFVAYDQLINSIDIEMKEKIKKYILKTIDPCISGEFYKAYGDGNYLPF